MSYVTILSQKMKESVIYVAQSSCPVVLFSHGAFGYYQSNISTYMELASNGYVVISLDIGQHVGKDADGGTG